MGHLEETQMMRELKQYTADNPEWIKLARKVLSSWTAGERLLVIAVAMGLQKTHENGKLGRDPLSDGTTKRVSRTHKTAEPEKQAPRHGRVPRSPRRA